MKIKKQNMTDKL